MNVNENYFVKMILTGIFICLVVIAFKSFDVNVSSPNPNINVDANIDGKEIIQLAPNRIAVVDNVRSSRMEGIILIFDYDSETKNFAYTASMNYADYFNNPDEYGITQNSPKKPAATVSGPISTATPVILPELVISIGDKNMKFIESGNIWGDKIYDREDAFKLLLKDGSGADLSTIEIGKTAVINFITIPPDKITVSDILLDIDGNQMYGKAGIIDIPVELKDGKCSFVLEKNISSALSSAFVEIDTRGLRIIASWGDIQRVYSCIIKTDGVLTR